VYQFTPLGTAFAGAEVRVAFEAAKLPAGGRPTLLIASPDGGWMEVSGTRIDGNTLVAQVPRLAYAVVVTSPDTVAPGTLNGPKLSVGLDADATLPTLPQPSAAGVIAVRQPTQVALTLNYALPATCTGQQFVRVYGVYTPKKEEIPNTAPVELANIPVAQLSGSLKVNAALHSFYNGVWTYAAEASCALSGALQPNYTLAGVGPVLAVDIPVGGSQVLSAAPRNTYAIDGDQVELKVAATGGSLHYHWERSNDGGVTYTTVGDDTPTLRLDVTVDDNGSLLRVGVSRDGSSPTVTLPAKLVVAPYATVPVIAEQPSSIAVLKGETASFMVRGSALPIASIQWQSRVEVAGDPEAGWQDMPGETRPVLTIQSASAPLQYRAVLSTSVGTVASVAANLSVQDKASAPSVVQNPPSQVVQAGRSGQFAVDATGTAGLSFQWFKNGQAIIGGNGRTLVMPASIAEVGTRFDLSVQISNRAGVVNSLPATMSVEAAGSSVSAASGGAVEGPDGVKLNVPPGALGSDARITLTPETIDPGIVPEGLRTIGSAVRLQTGGAVLSQPVELLFPAPADIPSGMTVAVVKLEEGGIQATQSSVSLKSAGNQSASTPASILTGNALATVIAVNSSSGVRFPDQVSCSNPQNIGSDGILSKFVSAPGLYIITLVPISTCTKVESRLLSTDVPSTTMQKCVDDADFASVSAITNAGKESLVNRHVYCLTGGVVDIGLSVDLKFKDGVYSYVRTSQDVQSGTVANYSLGVVRLKTYISFYGPSNQLSKKLAVGVKVVSFTPAADYPGPDRYPVLKIRPILDCTNSLEFNDLVSCGLRAGFLSVPLKGGFVSKDFTVDFDWGVIQDGVDEASFGVYVGHYFQYGVGGAIVDRKGIFSSDNLFYLTDLGEGVVVRCDRGVAKSNSSGCVFPNAAPVFVQNLTGAGVDEQAQHILEAQLRGAPGRFVMRPGSRAIPDDSVREGVNVLNRTQIEKVKDANRMVSCGGGGKSLISNIKRVSAYCASGATDCQCDEYPFASTYQGGALFRYIYDNQGGVGFPDSISAKIIRGADNGRSGSQLGAFYLRERVIDRSFVPLDLSSASDPLYGFNRRLGGDDFWVYIKH
jgi:hypothetical protein